MPPYELLLRIASNGHQEHTEFLTTPVWWAIRKLPVLVLFACWGDSPAMPKKRPFGDFDYRVNLTARDYEKQIENDPEEIAGDSNPMPGLLGVLRCRDKMIGP